jgi:hypothetical protein
MRAVAILGVLAAGTAGARADDRKPDASLAEIFRGPFSSSRLFSMPTADVIGAYIISLTGDGSLLQAPGRLTSSAVVAIGFGDLAQLEYRETAAISVTGVDAPVPAAGVQLKLPIPERPFVPALGFALRVGVARREQLGMTTVDETVHDFYAVARERLGMFVLHGGLRISSAHLVLGGDQMLDRQRTLWLPAAGAEAVMNRDARLVAEVTAAPQFQMDGRIGHGVLARAGVRWKLIPSVTLDATLGYQLADSPVAAADPRDVVSAWDIRLGAEVFVPWGALACRAAGAFCE